MESNTISKKKVILILSFLIIIVFWIKEPPFFKMQHIKISHVDKWVRGNEISKEYYNEVFYTYVAKSGKTIDDSFVMQGFFHDVKEKNHLVYTPYSEGGKFTVSFPMAVFVFLCLLFLGDKIINILLSPKKEKN